MRLCPFPLADGLGECECLLPSLRLVGPGLTTTAWLQILSQHPRLICRWQCAWYVTMAISNASCHPFTRLKTLSNLLWLVFIIFERINCPFGKKKKSDMVWCLNLKSLKKANGYSLSVICKRAIVVRLYLRLYPRLHLHRILHCKRLRCSWSVVLQPLFVCLLQLFSNLSASADNVAFRQRPKWSVVRFWCNDCRMFYYKGPRFAEQRTLITPKR